MSSAPRVVTVKSRALGVLADLSSGDSRAALTFLQHPQSSSRGGNEIPVSPPCSPSGPIPPAVPLRVLQTDSVGTAHARQQTAHKDLASGSFPELTRDHAVDRPFSSCMAKQIEKNRSA